MTLGHRRFGLEHRGHRSGEPEPRARLATQVLASGAGERVVTGAAVVLRDAPPRCDPALVLESPERRVERTLFDDQHVARGPLDPARDAETVLLAAGQRLQDDETERALQEIAVLFRHGSMVGRLT